MNEQDFDHQALYKNTTDGLFYFADWHASPDAPPPPRSVWPHMDPSQASYGHHCSSLIMYPSLLIPRLCASNSFFEPSISI
jgi:hypothetical protein